MRGRHQRHHLFTKIVAIKHIDAELDHFITSNQLEEPIVTSLVARKTLWDTTGRVRVMTGGD